MWSCYNMSNIVIHNSQGVYQKIKVYLTKYAPVSVVFILLWFYCPNEFLWIVYLYSLRLLHWYWDNHMIEVIGKDIGKMNHNLNVTKQQSLNRVHNSCNIPHTVKCGLIPLPNVRLSVRLSVRL